MGGSRQAIVVIYMIHYTTSARHAAGYWTVMLHLAELSMAPTGAETACTTDRGQQPWRWAAASLECRPQDPPPAPLVKGRSLLQRLPEEHCPQLLCRSGKLCKDVLRLRRAARPAREERHHLRQHFLHAAATPSHTTGTTRGYHTALN